VVDLEMSPRQMAAERERPQRPGHVYGDDDGRDHRDADEQLRPRVTGDPPHHSPDLQAEEHEQRRLDQVDEDAPEHVPDHPRRGLQHALAARAEEEAGRDGREDPGEAELVGGHEGEVGVSGDTTIWLLGSRIRRRTRETMNPARRPPRPEAGAPAGCRG
jgi:hypothetical protein